MPARFLTREQVADELNISMAQAYALIRRQELRAAKIGGRGIWRIGRDDLEAYIERTHSQTAHWIEEHPFEEDPD
jgi:excisionase family DNA binding protein